MYVNNILVLVFDGLLGFLLILLKLVILYVVNVVVKFRDKSNNLIYFIMIFCFMV